MGSRGLKGMTLHFKDCGESENEPILEVWFKRSNGPNIESEAYFLQGEYKECVYADESETTYLYTMMNGEEVFLRDEWFGLDGHYQDINKSRSWWAKLKEAGFE